MFVVECPAVAVGAARHILRTAFVIVSEALLRVGPTANISYFHITNRIRKNQGCEKESLLLARQRQQLAYLGRHVPRCSIQQIR